MTVLVGTKNLADRRSRITGKCAECHEKVYVRPWWASILKGGATLICLECAGEAFEGEVGASSRPVPGFLVYFDLSVLRHHEVGLAVDLATYEPTSPMYSGNGADSPRWVKCVRCAVARGDPCRGATYCHQRLEDNRIRLETLDSWAVEWLTPCHQSRVWLCWRKAGGLLRWHSVPCFEPACTRTYQVEMSASEQLERRTPIERLNPQRVEMECWAAEESDPWAKKR